MNDDPLFGWGESRPAQDLEKYRKKIGAVPELSDQDLKGLTVATQKVYAFMLDGKFHSASDIIAASGIREGLRRMRELRGKGRTIERQYDSTSGTREFWYRMI